MTPQPAPMLADTAPPASRKLDHRQMAAEVEYNNGFRERLPRLLRIRELQRWNDEIDAMWSKFAQIATERENEANLKPMDRWTKQSAKTFTMWHERKCDPHVVNDPENIMTCVYSPAYGTGWYRMSFYPVTSVVRDEVCRMYRVVKGSRHPLTADEIAYYEGLITRWQESQEARAA